MRLEHQTKDSSRGFKHRLVPIGTEGMEHKYPWVGYNSPALFHTTKGTFVAVSDYYKDSPEFPDPRKIYWVREAPEDI